jgi:hypothetical protein
MTNAMRLISLTFATLLCLLLFACEEQMLTLPRIQQSGDRVVLLEEFSGGNCNPCSKAAVEIENMLALYGDRLVVVTLHTYFATPQAHPASGSQYDFRTQAGTDVLNLMGVPFGIPAAGINRRPLSSNDDALVTPFSAWSGVVGAEAARTSQLGIGIDHAFDANARKVEFDVNIVPAQAFSGDLRLTVYLTESHIADKQLTDDGVIDWEHNHILRAVLTTPTGDVLPGTLADAFTRSFIYTLPNEDGGGPWKSENLHLIAFVTQHFPDGTMEVLQAVEVDLP